MNNQRKITLAFISIFVTGLATQETALGDVTAQLNRSSPKGPSKVFQYFSPKLIRVDTIEKDTTQITFVDDTNTTICRRENKPTAKGSCSMIETKKMLGITSAFFDGKGLAKVTNYSSNPTGKTGRFAGRNCNYFKRIMTISGIMGSTSTVTETLCIDGTLAKDMGGVAERFLNPWLNAMLDTKLQQKALSDRKKSEGFVLYRDIVSQTNLPTDKSSSKTTNPFPMDKAASKQLKELEAMQRQMQATASKPTKSESLVTTKVIVGPIPAHIFMVPPPQYELLKQK
jgi:hypothetical protein